VGVGVDFDPCPPEGEAPVRHLVAAARGEDAVDHRVDVVTDLRDLTAGEVVVGIHVGARLGDRAGLGVEVEGHGLAGQAARPLVEDHVAGGRHHAGLEIDLGVVRRQRDVLVLDPHAAREDGVVLAPELEGAGVAGDGALTALELEGEGDGAARLLLGLFGLFGLGSLVRLLVPLRGLGLLLFPRLRRGGGRLLDPCRRLFGRRRGWLLLRRHRDGEQEADQEDQRKWESTTQHGLRSAPVSPAARRSWRSLRRRRCRSPRNPVSGHALRARGAG